MSKRFAGKVAVVTGSSKGIGAAIAKRLAFEGAAVVVNYASSNQYADRVVASIESEGGRAIAIRADVSNPMDVQRLFSETHRTLGRADVLVNNAGIYAGAPLGEITAEHFHRHFDLNVLGLILVTQAALPYFSEDGGAIVNVSSVVSTLSPPGTAVYNASKSAVDGLTRTFAKELAPRNIRVNSINPGLIATEGIQAAGFVSEGSAPPAHLGRMGQPEHIAPGVAFLASSDSEWMTGETLYLTGGLG